MRKAPRAIVTAVGAIALGVLMPSVALADPASKATTEAQALDLFEKGSDAYQKGRFAEAVELLQKAYALKREPVLLYNLGRAFEGLGDAKSAARAYSEYLASEPNAPDRGALEQRIATLRRQAAEREELEQRARQRSEGRSASVLPWVVTGIGASTVIAGVVLGQVSSSRHDRAAEEPTYLRAEDLQHQAETFATVANVCFIAGAVITIGGIVWGVLDLSASRRAPAAAGSTATLTF